jgi:aldehyde:ferredoxin oxidoreductase
MPHGYAGSYLDIDLTTRSIKTKDTMPYAREYIGGRGIASRLAWETIPPRTGPFDPENRLLIFTGPLAGTVAPTSGRTFVMAVSPRTYPLSWVTFSTLGGWFAGEMKFAGFDGMVIGGKADSPVYIYVENGKAMIRDASDLWGMGTRETQIRLKERHGDKAQILCIGQAGENLSRMSTIQHAEENAAGRSGLGGVPGSKNLKAIVVRGTGGVSVARPAELFAEVKKAREKAWVSTADGFYDFCTG